MPFLTSSLARCSSKKKKGIDYHYYKFGHVTNVYFTGRSLKYMISCLLNTYLSHELIRMVAID